MISQRTIDDVFDQMDIVQMVEHCGVKLKKQGANYVGLSPWSNEKSPSFSVSPSKRIFKDFSSGKGGNGISFLMQLRGMNYPEAIEFAAEILNITVEKDSFDDEKQSELVSKRDRMRLFIKASNKQWREQLGKNPQILEGLKERGVSEEDVVEWQLGYSPEEWQFITDMATESAMIDEGIATGIVGEKAKKRFDLYRNRITIPIEDNFGNIISFGGRSLEAKPLAKYINGKDSELYNKSKVLFGYHRAANAIMQVGKVFLTEGYFDVISFHRAGITNTVASCGTAITPEQLKLLKRSTDCISLVMDGDKAGIKAAMKTIPMVLGAGLTCEVVFFEDGADPDDFIRAGGSEDELNGLCQNGILWCIEKMADGGKDPVLVEKAIEVFCEHLVLIGSETTREWYMDQCAKLFSFVKKTNLKKDFERIKKDIEQKRKKQEVRKSRAVDGTERQMEDGAIPVPSGTEDFYDDFGFYITNKQFYFFTADDKAFSVSNFSMTPLFHIHSKQDDRRLIQLERIDGRTAVIDIPSTSLVSMTDFKKELIQIPGNFMFRSKFTNHHFMKVVMYIGETMPVVYNLSTLGQQPEGFFAFADGIVKEGVFEKIDDFGIVKHLDEFEAVDGEKKSEDKMYYLPAFSKMNKGIRADEDPYENERALQYRESNVSLSEYFTLFDLTFREEKSKLGIAFLVASCFRDLFITKHNFFPLLFCYGEKGSGKSEFALTLQNFFFHNQQPYDLNAGTDVGFYRRMARVKNVVNFFDEFNDQVDDKRFQSLKGAWNGLGREKGVMSRDNRTETSKVNSALCLCGQYISARDDNSLTSRSILIEFLSVNPEDRPDSQRDGYQKLKVAREEGVSSLVVEILKHRPRIKKELNTEFRRLQKELRTALKGSKTMDRLVDNYAALLTPLSILKKELPLPFTFQSLMKTALEKMRESNEVMVDSEGVGSYWQIVQNLVETRVLQPGRDYEIKNQHLPLKMDSGDEYRNTKGSKMLFFRYQRIHGEYLKEFYNQFKVRGIDQQSLKGYLKARPYFLGSIKSHRMNSDVRSSVFVINYDELENTGVFLHEQVSSEGKPEEVKPPELPLSEADKEDDKMPF
jgi:DNA primase catalytic core